MLDNGIVVTIKSGGATGPSAGARGAGVAVNSGSPVGSDCFVFSGIDVGCFVSRKGILVLC